MNPDTGGGEGAQADGLPPLIQYLCFDTAIGLCGLAWSGQGIVGSQLPEASRGETRDRMRQRFPSAQKAREGDAVPAFVQDAMDCVKALASARPAAVSHVVLDERELTPFQRALFTLLGRKMTQPHAHQPERHKAVLLSPGLKHALCGLPERVRPR